MNEVDSEAQLTQVMSDQSRDSLRNTRAVNIGTRVVGMLPVGRAQQNNPIAGGNPEMRPHLLIFWP